MSDGDGPISRARDDLLGREPLVDAIVAQILVAPADSGFVIGVTGPWGSGKTSVLNLVERKLQTSMTVLHFEPWLFSGAEQLIGRFFGELSDQLVRSPRKRLRQVGKRMSEYGAAVAPAANVVLGPAGQLAGTPHRLLAVGAASAMAVRARLRAELSRRQARFLVVIDDVDRLAPDEIREVMRLVKLVGDLPGIVYLLGYEPARVEHALAAGGNRGNDGRAYLEKIVQAPFAVPPVSTERLRSLTFGWLDEAIDQGDIASWDPSAWSNLVLGGIESYIKTLRDGRRYVNIAPATLKLMRREVASTDVLALEAIRIFDPDVHALLPSLVEVLAGTRDLDFRSREAIEEDHRERVRDLLARSANRCATSRILRHLFPLAGHLFGGSRESAESGEWLKMQRVAARAAFERYLHAVLGPQDASIADVERVVSSLGDPRRLRDMLARIDGKRLGDLLVQVRLRLDRADIGDITEVALAFVCVGPNIKDPPSFFSVEPMRRALWMVDDLLLRAAESQRADIVRSLLRRAPSLSAHWQILTRYGTWSEEGSREPQLDILTISESNEAQHNLAEQILDASPDALAEEADLLRLANTVAEHAQHGRVDAARMLADDRVCRAALAMAVRTAQASTEHGSREYEHVDRDALVQLFGEEFLTNRVRTLDTRADPRAAHAAAAFTMQVSPES